jgi:hypothetical protein
MLNAGADDDQFGNPGLMSGSPTKIGVDCGADFDLMISFKARRLRRFALRSSIEGKVSASAAAFWL